WRSCSATISGRAVNTDNGDIISTAETTQNAAQLDDLSCGKEAIKKASRAFAQDMTKKIAARFVKDVSSGNDLHVTVRKVPSFRTASDFRAALSQRVRGVRNASQRSFSAETQEKARLEIRFSDNSVLRLGSRAKLQLAEAHFAAGAARRRLSARLFFGTLWAKVTSVLQGEQKFEVETENAVAGVRGTTFRV